MIKSASSPSDSSSQLPRPSDHAQRRCAPDSRVPEAGSKMKSEETKREPVSGTLKRTSSEVQADDLSAKRATPSQRRDSKENDDETHETDDLGGQAKRNKSNTGPRELPLDYENCAVSDLVQVICEMLMDLIRINDPLPLQEGGLTRFHSRVPPAISVLDYLHRLATHATLSPPILLSMVYYIDKLCALYPAFTISSLTVHRFLISSATVASKGLSDAFWTNGTYARVGGVSIKELALLELELLWRIDWRIVPQPEVLTDYYRSLVARSEGFKLEQAKSQ